MDKSTTAAALPKETVEKLLHVGQALGEPKWPTANGIPYAVIPNDCKVEGLANFIHNQYAERPHRKFGTVQVLDAASFVHYWQLFSDPFSQPFADETKSQVIGVLDYHGTGDNAPRWGQHRVSLSLRPSEEWKTWTGNDGKKLGQMDFAEFIEDNTPDIVTPSAADMLEMARTLQAKSEVDFGSAIRTSNGSVQLKYTETVKGTYGTGNVDVPEEFIIRIPVYVGTDRVPVRARLRYRINSGKLTFWYDLLRADAVQRDAFKSVLASIQEGIGTPIINGNPAA